MIRIKCTKCLEILELTDAFKTCSCHLVCIRAKTDANFDHWKSRIGARPEDFIILDEVERAYCLGCGKEMMTESGQVCNDCYITTSIVTTTGEGK